MKKAFPLIYSFVLLHTCMNAQFSVLKVDGMPGESARFKDKTELLGFVMEGTSPQTTATGGGMATGKRSYQPVTILKQTGPISPLLFQNFYTGRFIREINIEYYKADSKTGKEMLEYVITFRNVLIIGFKQFSGPLKNEQFDPGNNNLLCDEVKFNFQEIILDCKKGGVIAQDNIAR